ncbi:hypothetical protein KIN20_034115 [Parelaphostrongylus tenuis]|uniref:Uncharacterized protein n=1 Tax=Parelaphostrongylus tenuis TaxID=148309 RepID=A0AAD5R962_PARTN|nr:hypothetical protein KIN20_034115 [Parelaphostrongylus tenuis]
MTMSATNSRDRSSPPAISGLSSVSRINKPSTEQQVTLNIPNLSHKRHSAPDALQIIGRRNDPANSEMLPVIMEEKDRLGHHSSENSMHKKRRSSTRSLPTV